MFEPRYRITGKIAKALMAIEADRQIVTGLPLTAPMLDSLRRSARLLSTHFSTQIEGNQLSPSQVEAVVAGEGNFPGRERDELEVKHYFAALELVQKLGEDSSAALLEKEVRTIHGVVMTGKTKPTSYRGGQNVIRDSRSGQIVYLPPEAKDVPQLMKELVTWVNESMDEAELPVPVVAALAHYQFATIHPYFDGNGRTARLLTNLLLHRHGYGLHGIYSLEEYYAANLAGYYAGLTVGKSHNYYFGRAEGDVTGFVTYFCVGMADAFAKVRVRAEQANRTEDRNVGEQLRELSPQQRQVLGLFLKWKEVTRDDVARYFKLKPRAAYLLCARWVKAGFLEAATAATKGRKYRLAMRFEGLVVDSGRAQAVLRKK
jgi:Fic family protein